MIVYFPGTDAVGLAIMAVGGLVDRDVAVPAALFAPLALVGILVCQQQSRHHVHRGVRRVVVVLLLLLSVSMLARALAG